MDTIELADGGLLLYEEAFLPPDLADRYFIELRDTAPWEQKKAAFGRSQSRLTASYGDEGVTYFYSGTLSACSTSGPHISPTGGATSRRRW